MRLAAALVFVLSAFGLAAPAGAAPVLDTPEALIAYAYAPYATDAFPEDPFELYAPSLRDLAEADAARGGEDMVGALDFDPFIDAQDYGEVTATVESVAQSGDRADVAVTVSNFGEPARMVFVLEKTDAGWRIDDIIRTDGDYPWRLSELLAADPLLN